MDLSRLKTTRRIVNLQAGRNDWYRVIKAQAPDQATQVMVYDEIGYWGVTAQDFINEMKDVSGPVDLHLNSPGGEVFDGLAIYQYLSGRGDVTTYIDSLAASIASVIAMAGTEIVIGKNASVMIHDGFGLCVGNAADMREQADLLDRVSDNIASVYADRSGKPKDYWREQMLAETWYFGQEAVDAGLADRLASSLAKPQPDRGAQDDPATADMSAHFDLSLFSNVPERLRNLRNHAETPASTEPADAPDDAGIPDTAPQDLPPPTPEQFTNEVPADTDRGFPVAAAEGERGPEPEQLREGHVVNIDWSEGAGDELFAWLRKNIRIHDAASHGPFAGTHTHAHAAFGEQGDDGSHEHEHSHDGDANHNHDHGDEESDAGGMQNTAPARILGIESMPLENKALPIHHTATTDEAWDGPAAVAAMPNDDAVLRYCHAWMSNEAAAEKPEKGDDDPNDQKSNYRFPHHKTEGGPANLAACRNGLARLEGSKIPDSDKSGVKAHLQAHLDDADKSDDDGGASNTTNEDLGDAWAFDLQAFREAMEGANP